MRPRSSDEQESHPKRVALAALGVAPERIYVAHGVTGTNQHRPGRPLVVRAVDLAGVGSICDVGGGTGRLLRALLDAAPAARGTVFDLPDVVSGAPGVLGDLPPDRWNTVSGSFFDAGAIPAGHDRYVMQAIAHDWGDDDAGVILGNVRDAMSSGSRLWVIDSVLDPAAVDDMSKAVDMLMLTVTERGRERTQEEWTRLFASSGFAIEAQTELPVLISVFTLALA